MAKIVTSVGTTKAPAAAAASAASASIWVPCSIERTPSAAQRRTRACRVRMRHHIGAARRRFLHADADLLVGVLIHPERVRRREHAARDHHLDLVRALAKLLPRRLADRIDPVRNLGDGPMVGSAGTGSKRVWLRMSPWPPVLAQPSAREEDPGARDQALLHPQARRPRSGAACVPHRGEAPPERPFETVPRVLVEQATPACLRYLGDVEIDEKGVEVGIDQARHQRAPAAGHALRIGRRPDRAVGDVLDAAVLDHHGRVLARLGGDPVEDPASLEDDRHSAAPFPSCRLPAEAVGRPPRVRAARNRAARDILNEHAHRARRPGPLRPPFDAVPPPRRALRRRPRECAPPASACWENTRAARTSWGSSWWRSAAPRRRPAGSCRR